MSKTDLWMPLYVGEYLADTGHLTTTQHGAYLLLIMHYWRKRELPSDDKQLAAIAKLPLRIWLDTKETLQAFFYDGWRHKRIEAEFQRRLEVSEKRASAGAKGGLRSRSKSEANAPVCLSMIQLQEQKEDRIGNASAGASAFTPGSKALATSFLTALGFDTPLKVPPEFAGVDWRAIEWERAGWTADLIEAEARKNAGKPLTYHEKCFATAFAKRQAPLPIVEIKEAEKVTVSHGSNAHKSGGSLTASLRRDLAALEQSDGADYSLPAGRVLRLQN